MLQSSLEASMLQLVLQRPTWPKELVELTVKKFLMPWHKYSLKLYED
jgi:hypothetical protein